MSEHTKGRLFIEDRPPHSPRRMWLCREGGGRIYWVQERKTGAGRGASPRWLGFDKRDADIMRRLAACWNACLGIDDPEAYLAAVRDATRSRDKLKLVWALETLHDRMTDGPDEADAATLEEWAREISAILSKHKAARGATLSFAEPGKFTVHANAAPQGACGNGTVGSAVVGHTLPAGAAPDAGQEAERHFGDG